MTKEQVDSIEILENTELDINTIYNVDLYTYNIAVKNILSMLKEKDKQIDKSKKHNDELLRKLKNRVKQVKKLEKYSTYKSEFSRLNKKIVEQNKIIDLMSEMLNNHDIDEDICRQMGQKENCNEFTDKENCKACIKQYFENKAKEVK